MHIRLIKAHIDQKQSKTIQKCEKDEWEHTIENVKENLSIDWMLIYLCKQKKCISPFRHHKNKLLEGEEQWEHFRNVEHLEMWNVEPSNGTGNPNDFNSKHSGPKGRFLSQVSFRTKFFGSRFWASNWHFLVQIQSKLPKKVYFGH